MSNIMISFRINKELKEIIERICEARGEDVSDFIRRSIKRELARLSFLPEDEKKALEVIA